MIDKLRKECEKFLSDNDLSIDTRFYTQEEWEARGEPHGNGAPLSLTFEGALYSVLNGYNRAGGKLAEQFYAIAERHGYFVELGFAWSAHFYKI